MISGWKNAPRHVRLLIVVGALAVLGGAPLLWAATRTQAVEIARPEKNVRSAIFGLGTIEARIQSKVGFEIAGILAELNVDHGDLLRAGDVLARLRSIKQEARVAKAKAVVLNAEATLKRAEAAAAKSRAQLAHRKRINQRRQTLLEKQYVSEEAAQQAKMDEEVALSDTAVTASDIEITRATVEDAKSQLAYEHALLNDHVLRAPYDAVVVTRHKELGSALANGEALFTLVDPKTVWVLAHIDEARAGPLAIGQIAKIRLRSLPGQTFAGRVTRIAFESDRVTEERRVYATCDDCPQQFHLGEQAEVEIDIATIPAAPLVPEKAVSNFDGAVGLVWTVEDGVLRRRTVSFRHRTLDARLEVAGGLPAGAVVVVEPTDGLREGTAVRIAGSAVR